MPVQSVQMEPEPVIHSQISSPHPWFLISWESHFFRRSFPGSGLMACQEGHPLWTVSDYMAQVRWHSVNMYFLPDISQYHCSHRVITNWRTTVKQNKLQFLSCLLCICFFFVRVKCWSFTQGRQWLDQCCPPPSSMSPAALKCFSQVSITWTHNNENSLKRNTKKTQTWHVLQSRFLTFSHLSLAQQWHLKPLTPSQQQRFPL